MVGQDYLFSVLFIICALFVVHWAHRFHF